MVSVVDAATALVLTVNVALVFPAGMVTLPGTEAIAGASLESATTAPPLGAGPLNVNVPVEGIAPVTLAGSSASEARTTGVPDVRAPSTQNSKKLRDHPLPSPTLLVTMRKNLACALSASVPL